MFLFVLDVESDGLYGEGFAFAAVVFDQQGTQLASCSAKCITQEEPVEDKWAQKNVLPYLDALPSKATRREVRDEFWRFYQRWKDKSYIMADVAYPVEAGFLAACVRDDLESRKAAAPYPLLDISSLMLAGGYDSLTDGAAFTNQYGDVHNPLYDAKTSAQKVVRLIKEHKIRFPE